MSEIFKQNETWETANELTSQKIYGESGAVNVKSEN